MLKRGLTLALVMVLVGVGTALAIGGWGVDTNNNLSVMVSGAMKGVWGSSGLRIGDVKAIPAKSLEITDGAGAIVASIDNTGAIVGVGITNTGDTLVGATKKIGWTAQSVFLSPSDGVIEMTNAAGTAFTRLQFGGTTSSFPAIKRASAALNFRLADDSADAAITAGATTLSGTLALGANALTSTGTAGFGATTLSGTLAMGANAITSTGTAGFGATTLSGTLAMGSNAITSTGTLSIGAITGPSPFAVDTSGNTTVNTLVRTTTDVVQFYPAVQYCQADDANPSLLTPKRIAQSDKALARTASAGETYNVVCSIPAPTRTTSGKGYKLASFRIAHQITVVDLTTDTFNALATVTYVDNVANAIAAYGGSITITMPTVARAGPYLTAGTVGTPAFMNTANAQIVFDFTVVMANTGVYRLYGISATWTVQD